MTPAALLERFWCFAARIGKVIDVLPEPSLGRHIAGQLVRRVMSAPPNYDESRVGKSRADFTHKVSIALKELVETRGLLEFIARARLLPTSPMQGLAQECDELCRILGKSLSTARGRRAGMPPVNSSSPADFSI